MRLPGQSRDKVLNVQFFCSFFFSTKNFNQALVIRLEVQRKIQPEPRKSRMKTDVKVNSGWLNNRLYLEAFH